MRTSLSHLKFATVAWEKFGEAGRGALLVLKPSILDLERTLWGPLGQKAWRRAVAMSTAPSPESQPQQPPDIGMESLLGCCPIACRSLIWIGGQLDWSWRCGEPRECSLKMFCPSSSGSWRQRDYNKGRDTCRRDSAVPLPCGLDFRGNNIGRRGWNVLRLCSHDVIVCLPQPRLNNMERQMQLRRVPRTQKLTALNVEVTLGI